MKIGDLAPDFELPLGNGERFRLRNLRGLTSVVLYFYPRDFTWGCTREGCMFSEHITEISKLGAFIVGISADSVESHRKFSEANHFPFPLASDEGMEVCRMYDAVWFWGNTTRRMTYVIDQRGIIRGKTLHEIFIERHWKYVSKILRDLKDEAKGHHVHEN
ncbi:MAG TPA: peroxiredoxin [Bacteroidota bacterium]|nr:peroxiredoxin [Bacteroidota bacterium]